MWERARQVCESAQNGKCGSLTGLRRLTRVEASVKRMLNIYADLFGALESAVLSRTKCYINIKNTATNQSNLCTCMHIYCIYSIVNVVVVELSFPLAWDYHSNRTGNAISSERPCEALSKSNAFSGHATATKL